ARSVDDFQLAAEKSCGNLFGRWCEALDIRGSCARDVDTRLDQRGVPRFERGQPHRRLQRRVALSEHAPIAFPGGQVIMFHVEHAPVDESAALARSSLDQAVNTWIDHIDCETARDLRDGSGGRAVDPVLDTVRPKLNAYTAMHIPVSV